MEDRCGNEEYEFRGELTCRPILVADVKEGCEDLSKFARKYLSEDNPDLEVCERVFGYASDMICSLADQLGVDIMDIEANAYSYCFYMPDGTIIPAGGLNGKNKRRD